jgi:hypothetical protein
MAAFYKFPPIIELPIKYVVYSIHAGVIVGAATTNATISIDVMTYPHQLQLAWKAADVVAWVC